MAKDYNTGSGKGDSDTSKDNSKANVGKSGSGNNSDNSKSNPKNPK